MSNKKESDATILSRKKSAKDLCSRRIIGYPNRKYYSLFVCRCIQMERTKSEMVDKIVREYFDKLSAETQQKYLDQFKLLTPRQIKYTLRALDAE